MVESEINLRQRQILNQIIEEYIDSAVPVSSQFVTQNCGFEVCPATIRNEMQKLTEAGFLFQPHTSAGRVPTDKAYCFFVDNLLTHQPSAKDFLGQYQKAVEEIEEIFNLAQSLTKNLSNFSLNLTIGYVNDSQETTEKPELEASNLVANFLKLVKSLEKEIDDFKTKNPLYEKAKQKN